MKAGVGFKVSVYAAAALSAAVFLFYMWSDAAAIRRTFSAVERLAGRRSGETVMEGAIRAKGIAGCFSDSCRFVLPEYGIDAVVSRENAAGSVLAFRSGLKVFDISFEDLEIDAEDGAASVEGVVFMSGAPSRDGFPLPFRSEFKARLRKLDGSWVFTSCIFGILQNHEGS